MQFSRTGAGSVLVGVAVLGIAWWLGWNSLPVNQAIIGMLSTAIAGGAILFGLFLLAMGVLLFFI